MRIKFDEPIIGKDNVLEIGSKELDDFYAAASDIDRINLFFILLASLHYYEEKGDTVRTAHLSFLMAYYVFAPLTPRVPCPILYEQSCVIKSDTGI